MKTNLNEVKRMQKMAGIITESHQNFMATTIGRTAQSSYNTSFFGNTLYATRAQLKSILGTPTKTYTNRDKSQYEWVLEIAGHVFTVYDWKEYRSVEENEPIEWHIGAHSPGVANYAHEELSSLLKK